jgi:hypothetical protein
MGLGAGLGSRHRGPRLLSSGIAPFAPPPTAIASPLIATERGEARNAITSATSAAVTSRPIDTPSASAAGGVRSVTVGPGWTTVTLIPCGPSSSARFFVSALTATLRTEPTTEPVERAASPLTLMIRPQPSMCGTTARAIRR